MSSLNLLQGNLKFIVSETILLRDASSISFPENFEIVEKKIYGISKIIFGKLN